MSTIQDPVRQAVEDYLAENDTVISAVAAKDLIENILPHDVLINWLWAHRHDTLTAYVTRVCRMTGARDARDKQRGAFADQVEQLEAAIDEAEATGTTEPIHEITKLWHCANADGQPVRKRLGDMTKAEVNFVKNRAANNVRYYTRRIRFLELLAERLNDEQTVSDVFTADELQAVLDSIT
jgi:hypothetical protein